MNIEYCGRDTWTLAVNIQYSIFIIQFLFFSSVSIVVKDQETGTAGSRSPGLPANTSGGSVLYAFAGAASQRVALGARGRISRCSTAQRNASTAQVTSITTTAISGHLGT